MSNKSFDQQTAGFFIGFFLVFAFLSCCKNHESEKSVQTQSQTLAKTVSSDAQVDKTPISKDEFNEIQAIISASCMPCHNRGTLQQVIERTQKARFTEIDGDARIRILGELEELNSYMKNGMPISFTSEEELYKFFAATPGEFYMMLDKGLMPPAWAPELMKQIQWPNYQVLQSQQRMELLKFSQPYTAKYLH